MKKKVYEITIQKGRKNGIAYRIYQWSDRRDGAYMVDFSDRKPTAPIHGYFTLETAQEAVDKHCC